MKRSTLAIALGACSIGLVGWAAWSKSQSSGAHAAGSSSSKRSDVPTLVEWCADGLTAIAGGGCWAAPSDAAANAPVVLYLHGRYEASAPAEELDRQKRVAKEANRRGFAVLALRGEVGACQRAELATFVCWPSNERNADAGPTFVDRWREALDEVLRRTQSPKRFVFGFSNGAYFAGLLATRGLFEASAFVVSAGGPVDPVAKPARAGAPMPPILLLTGDEDPSAEDTIRFAKLLSGVGWPNDIYSRDGGHLLTDADIRAAFAFFERAPREPLPLVPPLSTRRPAPHAPTAREASAPEPVDGVVDLASTRNERDETEKANAIDRVSSGDSTGARAP